jgi:hypothetical protein
MARYFAFAVLAGAALLWCGCNSCPKQATDTSSVAWVAYAHQLEHKERSIHEAYHDRPDDPDNYAITVSPFTRSISAANSAILRRILNGESAQLLPAFGGQPDSWVYVYDWEVPTDRRLGLIIIMHFERGWFIREWRSPVGALADATWDDTLSAIVAQAEASG